LNSVLTKISAIKRNPNNPRILKDDKFVKLTQSIKDFPQMLDIRPIVVNDDMVVLGGNMRLKACKEAGLSEVPVIKVDDLTEEQQREFIIKDNVGFGEWDWDLLANEWDTDLLEDWGLDLDFDPVDDDNAGLTDEDDVPEVTENPVSKVGDIWLLGEHRVMCGDSTNGGDVALLMNGEKADLLHTDPPYGVNMKRSGSIIGDSIADIPRIIGDAIDNAATVTKDGACWYCWIGFRGYSVAEMAIEKHRKVTNCIVWKKPSIGLGKTGYRYQHELCIFSGEIESNSLPDVWEFNRDSSGLHPTMKPVELVEKAISDSSKAGDCVIDLFLGSGSTLIASEKKNRKCYGMELDPKYVDVIIKRWQDYTGKKAIHAESGEQFMEG